MKTAKETSLSRALEEARLQNKGLPPRYQDGKDPFWIKAIVLVMKRNMEECYCFYEQNADRYMRLIQDFGTPSPVISIKSIHPFMYLDSDQFIPRGGIDAKRAYLKELLDNDTDGIDVDNLSASEVEHILLEKAIAQQLLNDEVNRQQNLRNEGSDIDGSNFDEADRVRFEMELDAMKRDGSSQEEMDAFKYAFEHRNDPTGEDLPYLSVEDRTRLEMELKDEKQNEKSVSVEGEFDEPDIDIDKLRKASEEYRKEQIKIAKRKWKRAFDGDANLRKGFVCENEFGEKEEIETLQLPDAEQKPEVKRAPGRPRKSAKKTTARKSTGTRKSTSRKTKK
jgi:hypothetical protein